ncbi:MAG: AAA family ATPase [Myxococcaceae bacterium]|nr:AAA family ATPase [Myxococcaceae bacterium]MBH2005909.1 AAA family ATPase [Myxococcaceae bacterium]
MYAPSFSTIAFWFALAPSAIASTGFVKPVWGKSRFESLIREGAFSDRSGLVSTIDKSRSAFMLISCPSQSGKTAMLSMLKAYYDPENSRDKKVLFASLNVGAEQHDPGREFGKHPVIDLSFRNIDRASFAGFQLSFSGKIHDLFRNFKMALDSSTKIPTEDRKKYQEIAQNLVNRSAEQAGMDFVFLTGLLERHYGQVANSREVIVLLDDYDNPASDASDDFVGTDVAAFLTRFFEVALKDNRSVYRVVFAGGEDRYKMLKPLGIVSRISVDSPHKAYCGLTEQQAKDMGAEEEELKKIPKLSTEPVVYRLKETIDILSHTSRD